MGDGLAVEEAPDEPDRLIEPIEPLAEAGPEVEPERLVLALEPAPAETEHEAPVREVVDGRRELGGQARVAEGVGGHQQAEPDLLGEHSEGGECRPALELRVGGVAFVGEQVVVDPERVPARALDGEAGVAQGRPARPVRPECRAEPHRTPSSDGFRARTLLRAAIPPLVVYRIADSTMFR